MEHIDKHGNEPRFHELKATGQMPSPTGVALALLELTQSDDTSIGDIARLLQGDPAMTGRLLQFVNSPMLGTRRAVASVSEAVLLVGLHVVRQIVLGLSVLSTYREGHCEEFDYERFWSHSLAMAVSAELLCGRDHCFPPEEAFTAGLLAGVGQLALATIYPEQYNQVLRRTRGAPPAQRLAAEREAFLIDHLQLTAAMLQDWGLPSPHVSAVAAIYGQPITESASRRSASLAAVLRTSQVCAELMHSDAAGRGACMETFVRAAASLGIDEDQLQGWLETFTGQWREWAKILALPTTDVPAAGAPAGALPSAVGDNEADDILTVLLVEDEAVSRRVLSEQLDRSGYRVVLARNGREGLAAALEHNPEIVITDWMMPGMDGLTFCRALRRTRFGEQMYVIILTAREEDPHVTEAVAAGADDYIVKPASTRILSARLAAGARKVRLQNTVETERKRNRESLAELAVMNRRLEQAVLTDPLTGLPNRRYATRRLNQAWAAAKRNGEMLTCMLIDVDHFKSVNDACGHDAGDHVLCDLAMVLRGAARADDEVCRIGGEEFLVICAASDEFGARATAERLRRKVEKHAFGYTPPNGPTTISIGLAARPARATTPDSLMKLADQAVYAAKAAGRNCVICSESEPGSDASRDSA